MRAEGWVTIAGLLAFVIAVLVAGAYVAQQVAGGLAQIAPVLR